MPWRTSIKLVAFQKSKEESPKLAEDEPEAMESREKERRATVFRMSYPLRDSARKSLTGVRAKKFNIFLQIELSNFSHNELTPHPFE